MAVPINTIKNITFNARPKAASKPTNPPKDNPDKNPISKSGEKMVLVAATFMTGLGVGTRLLFELLDGDFLFEHLNKKAGKIVNKSHPNASSYKKTLLGCGAAIGLIAAAISGIAFIYTLFKAPSINYKGNLNAFQKGKDMDVFIKGTGIEKQLYEQLNDKAKTADKTEKVQLYEQYMKMQMAKTQIPEFIKQ